MKIDGVHYRSIMQTGSGIRIIDQRLLPWELRWVELTSIEAAATAIKDMWTRGAPMIGATAAYGLAMALRDDPSDISLHAQYQLLLETRPTAVNLRWALDRIVETVRDLPPAMRAAAAFARADALCDEDVSLNRAIGEHGLKLLCALHARHPERPLNILTHCNAGWLATVDYGTALAPIYLAQEAGIPVHVWVDETRPRGQGGLLTAYELAEQGVSHKVVADNAGGLLMQRGEVDVCIVGADRVTRNGDVCNKIGTYLKALAAHDTGVPFYVALPYTTIDLSMENGGLIPIEERSETEVSQITGPDRTGQLHSIRTTASPAYNPAFDVTPARLITGYITESGVIARIEA